MPSAVHLGAKAGGKARGWKVALGIETEAKGIGFLGHGAASLLPSHRTEDSRGRLRPLTMEMPSLFRDQQQVRLVWLMAHGFSTCLPSPMGQVGPSSNLTSWNTSTSHHEERPP